MTKTEEIQTLVTFEYSNELGCLVWTLPFIGILLWSINMDKYVWTVVSILFVFLIINQVYKTYWESIKFNEWIEKHNQNIIFFYPTKRETQEQIKNKIGVKLNSNISQRSYRKSKITGDINNQNFIKMGLSQLNRLNPNHPRLIQIEGNSLVELINLYELNRVSQLEETRIEQIVNEINTYA